VDASSSWAFRRKGHRVVVGGAGMWVELAAAAVAALVWAGTREGTTVHVIAYNVLFVGSVSTLLFNANPLLRYDGYYILSDLIEIPNLAQRSRDFLSYLVRRYAWGVRHVRSPAHTRGEGVWLLVYALASTVYRVFISVAILLFISSKLPFIGAVLALAAVVAWLLVPLGRFVHYLAASTELARVRARAVLVSAVAVAAVAAPLGLLPLSDPVYVEGVVEPREMAIVHAGADGFLTSYLASGMRMSPEGEPLVRSANPTLAAERRQLAADRRQLEARRNLAQTEEPAAVQILDEQIQALAEKTRRLDEQLAALRVRAPLEGLWFAPDLDQRQGAYLRRGDAIGLAATLEDLVVRAVAGQDVAGRLRTEAAERVVMRVVMRPDLETGGTVRQFLPAGRRRLPSPALGYAAGGPIAVTAEDRTGTQAAERFFEIHVSPDPAGPWRLFVGQRVVIRFETQPKPLLLQGWRWVLQLLQRRFQV